MRVAYLVNQYPKVSHSFIRREIHAIEELGFTIDRYSIRPVTNDLVDAADISERSITRAILGAGLSAFVLGIIFAVAMHPVSFCRALSAAVRMGWGSHRGLLRHLAYLLEACVLLRWLSETNAQHVHAHFGTNAPMVALLCKILGGPSFSFTIHGSEFDHAYQLSLDEKVAESAFAVTISSFGRSQLYRWCNSLHWDKIHVIPCGLDELFLLEQRIAVSPLRQLVCVARLAPEKGLSTLVQAAELLKAQGHDFQLFLLGDGPIRNDLEQAVAKFSLSGCVHITGWASSAEVRDHILNSRALVLSSYVEGLPVVLMEAMALGRPVISTWVAGIPELVTHGVNGWLVPPGDVEALAAAMKEALEAPVEQLEEMGCNGAGKVRENHDARKEAVKLAELFRQSIENWGQAPMA